MKVYHRDIASSRNSASGSAGGVRNRMAKKLKKIARKLRYVAVAVLAWYLVFFANAALHRDACRELLKGDLPRSLSLLRFVVTFEPDFYMHRGRMGKAALRNAFIETDAQRKKRLAWIFETGGPVIGSPAAADGAVYIGSNDDFLYKLHAATGKLLWKFDANGDIETKPLVADDKIYIASHNGLYALTKDGKEVWFRLIRWAESSPAYVSGTVFVGTDDNRLLALDAETGKTRWEFQTADSVESSPSVAGGRVFVGCNSDMVYALDAETGKKEWSYNLGGKIEGKPLVTGGAVFIGSNSGEFVSIDEKSGKLLWRRKLAGNVESSAAGEGNTVAIGTLDGNLYALDANNGSTLWKYDSAGPFESSPLIYRGVVYVGCHYGFIHAVDLKTGKKRWRFLTCWDIDESIPAVSGGLVFIGGTDGRVYALRID